MQQTVRVDDETGNTLGQGVLVSPVIVVLELGGSAPPQLPLRVLVPADAGVSRNEHSPPQAIPVAAVHPGEGRDAVALELSRPSTSSDRADRTMRRSVSLAKGTRVGVVSSDGQQQADGWLCRWFPSLCK